MWPAPLVVPRAMSVPGLLQPWPQAEAEAHAREAQTILADLGLTQDAERAEVLLEAAGRLRGEGD